MCPLVQDFYECESGSVSSASHSRNGSVDLTGFSSGLEHKPSGGTAAAAAAGGAGGGGGGAPGGIAPVVVGGTAPAPMRRIGSRTSLPAPESAASSPARTPLARGSAAGVAAAAVELATEAAVGVGPLWLAKVAKEGPPPPRRDRLPPPQQQEKSVRCAEASFGAGCLAGWQADRLTGCRSGRRPLLQGLSCALPAAVLCCSPSLPLCLLLPAFSHCHAAFFLPPSLPAACGH